MSFTNTQKFPIELFRYVFHLYSIQHFARILPEFTSHFQLKLEYYETQRPKTMVLLGVVYSGMTGIGQLNLLSMADHRKGTSLSSVIYLVDTALFRGNGFRRHSFT